MNLDDKAMLVCVIAAIGISALLTWLVYVAWPVKYPDDGQTPLEPQEEPRTAPELPAGWADDIEQWDAEMQQWMGRSYNGSQCDADHKD